MCSIISEAISDWEHSKKIVNLWWAQEGLRLSKWSEEFYNANDCGLTGTWE